MDINHELEAQMAANHGHELGCFEQIAERVIEKEGLEVQSGAFNEEIAGMTILERMIPHIDQWCTCREDEEGEEG